MDWLAGAGGSIVVLGIILTILGIGGRATLKFWVFTLAAGAGIIVIIFGLIVTAFGLSL